MKTTAHAPASKMPDGGAFIPFHALAAAAPASARGVARSPMITADRGGLTI